MEHDKSALKRGIYWVSTCGIFKVEIEFSISDVTLQLIVLKPEGKFLIESRKTRTVDTKSKTGKSLFLCVELIITEIQDVTNERVRKRQNKRPKIMIPQKIYIICIHSIN